MLEKPRNCFALKVNRLFSSFNFSDDLADGTDFDADGYELMYGNFTALGMSGGSVIDTGGRVIGIHGRAVGNQVSGKVGINLGILINLLLCLCRWG